MAFIPSACPSYEGRTHSWDRTDIVPRFRWITYLLYCIKGPLTEHREWMTSHADLPTFLWFEFSPHYFTEKSHQKVLILTHPMAPAELKFRSWVSSPLPPSRPSRFPPQLDGTVCIHTPCQPGKARVETNPILGGLWSHWPSFPGLNGKE